MRAIAVEQFKAEPRLMNLPQPVPKDDQLLVQVGFAGMNPYDWKVADGIMQGAMPTVFPLILGSDAAGTVTAIGAKVTRYVPGDRIFGSFFHAPIGEGTYAEFAVVPESGAVTKTPAGLGDDLAAALPTAGMTALALVDKLDLKSGSKVLIVGATGGVGLYATQIAARKGLHVLATAGAGDVERLRRFGASETFDYRGGDLDARLAALHPQGIAALIDLASDAAGFKKLALLVAREGYALSTIGAANTPFLLERGVHGGNFYLKADAELLTRLATWVEQGRLEVVIEARISLESTPAAIAASRRGGARGKTVIRM